MSRKYKFIDQNQAYFVSFAAINWIDLFTRSIYSDVVVESLRYCQLHKGLVVYAWCIMPSHVHLIIGTNKDRMQDILRDLKSYTSRNIKQLLNEYPYESRKEWILRMCKNEGYNNSNNKDWQLWQQDNHPIELRGEKMIDQKMEYIHFNPVKAGYVESPEHWMYSSARNYYGLTGLLEVELGY